MELLVPNYYEKHILRMPADQWPNPVNRAFGARYDGMDPKYMEWMAGQIPKGSYLYCPNGSHFAFYDDQVTYFEGLIAFIRKTNVAS